MTTEFKTSAVEVKGLDDIDMPSQDMLVFVAGDGERLSIDRKAALQSTLIETMVTGDKEEKEMPLPNIKGAILKLVVAYLNHHKDNPASSIEKPLKSANLRECVSEWDAVFMHALEHETVLELILVSVHCLCRWFFIIITHIYIGCELYGHKATSRSRLCKDCESCQGKDARSNP